MSSHTEDDSGRPPAWVSSPLLARSRRAGRLRRDDRALISRTTRASEDGAGTLRRWALRDSNLRPLPCKGSALPAELSARQPRRARRARRGRDRRPGTRPGRASRTAASRRRTSHRSSWTAQSGRSSWHVGQTSTCRASRRSPAPTAAPACRGRRWGGRRGSTSGACPGAIGSVGRAHGPKDSKDSPARALGRRRERRAGRRTVASSRPAEDRHARRARTPASRCRRRGSPSARRSRRTTTPPASATSRTTAGPGCAGPCPSAAPKETSGTRPSPNRPRSPEPRPRVGARGSRPSRPRCSPRRPSPRRARSTSALPERRRGDRRRRGTGDCRRRRRPSRPSRSTPRGVAGPRRRLARPKRDHLGRHAHRARSARAPSPAHRSKTLVALRGARRRADGDVARPAVERRALDLLRPRLELARAEQQERSGSRSPAERTYDVARR